MTLLTDPSFLSAVTAAFVTGVFGPLVLQYFKLKFRKKSDPLHQELKLSNIINQYNLIFRIYLLIFLVNLLIIY